MEFLTLSDIPTSRSFLGAFASSSTAASETQSLRHHIYLDHNATAPLAKVVADHVPQWLENWGNPSSIHQSGRGPKTVMREAREKIAKLLGVAPLEIVFTSGGSEANSLALKGLFETFAKSSEDLRRNHYLFSNVEHPSVMNTARYLRSKGAEVSFIPVHRSGAIDMAIYEQLLSEKTAVVSVMYANNETGNIFPIREMVELAHKKGALFHCDCVQALGKVPFSLKELDVDLASVAGHKFYALKGVGALFVRRGLQLESLVHGGGQERQRRGGTENVLAIASLGLMCGLASEIAPRAEKMRELRDHMETRILNEISEVYRTGSESARLPNTSSLVIPGVDGETLLMNLDMRGFSVSTGAACSSGSPEPSPVLLAMGLTRAEAQASLRVGLGWGTRLDDLDAFVEILKAVVAHLRSFNSPLSALAHETQVDEGQRKIKC